MRFAIIDIETTGGNYQSGKILEIAVVLHDGESILDQWTTLLNPETYIPAGITELTGITQDMVRDAPRFFEIAAHLVKLTEGAIFVAHNVRFDYDFIWHEFHNLGYAFQRRKLCTIQLARRIFPGLGKYGLSALTQYFGLENPDRHRALGDALTTSALFQLILKEAKSQEVIQNLVNQGIEESRLPANLSITDIEQLPETCGVYYMRNQENEVIYVGKSKNIQKRVSSHFTDHTQKTARLLQQVHTIDYEETGSELVSLILESYRIKELKPAINKAQRVARYIYAIISFRDSSGYICFGVKPRKEAEKLLNIQIHAGFGKAGAARARLDACQNEFNLCHALMHGERLSGKPCFAYHLKKCLGACCLEESPSMYNLRANQAILRIQKNLAGSFLLIDVGRQKGEWSVIGIRDGKFVGYAYMEQDFTDSSLWDWENSLSRFPENEEVSLIITNYLAKHALKKLPVTA